MITLLFPEQSTWRVVFLSCHCFGRHYILPHQSVKLFPTLALNLNLMLHSCILLAKFSLEKCSRLYMDEWNINVLGEVLIVLHAYLPNLPDNTNTMQSGSDPIIHWNEVTESHSHSNIISYQIQSNMRNIRPSSSNSWEVLTSLVQQMQNFDGKILFKRKLNCVKPIRYILMPKSSVCNLF